MRMSRKAKRELSWILLILACAPFLYLLIYGDGGYLQLRSLNEELHQMQMDHLELRRQRQSLQEQIEKIRTDPEELERIARERYNFARQGDIIVNVP
jgi:cell division protein FtsB